ncbi:TetR/AcrR family transcriptional regulator [Micromonospora sp. NBC_01796]|uniref:TetR/AcrR family transcriptional regulator n=1 Tax=Micromonospora sp. NBC_01796 TaxID=2975987 RepID=UPI002DDBFD0C|nr:TetR family transcriptional regulator [Micromonospora sp. NBC_01796]WSA84402.1 TetR family transcriptional regulator [Micromonospora sp. NBC_01796]
MSPRDRGAASAAAAPGAGSGPAAADPAAPPRRSDATRAAILRAARERFAADGYDRATIRAIATDAAIDPSMVMRYYGSKERLFAAAAEFDLRLPDFGDLPADRIGSALVAHFLDRWEEDETMIALLRAGATNPAAAERMRQIFADQVAPAIGAFAVRVGVPSPGGDAALSAEQRAGLITSQVLGLALTRYVLRLPPVVGMDRAVLVDWLGPTIQRYLLGRP